MKKRVTNFAASVRDRLLRHTKRNNGDFQLSLRRYSIERFLYRLGASPLRDRFVLKGAMLFALWDAAIDRPTKDLDLAGFWPNDAVSLVAAIKEILAIPCPEDGITFATDAVTAVPIRHKDKHHGFRVFVTGELAAARLSLQIDVGFGDAIEPPATFESYPVVLDGPAPRIRAYPREASIAEKLHAMVVHGLANTRLKDFFDVYLLSSRFPFSGDRVTAAITATFTRRDCSSLEPWPTALTSGFYEDAPRAAQWRRFLDRTNLGASAPDDFTVVGERIREFLDGPLRATHLCQAFTATWPRGGPWQ